MTKKNLPNSGITSDWDLGAPFKTDMDANLRRIDSLLMPRVKSRTTTTPPSSPAEGDSYIVASGATGVWANQYPRLAVYLDGAWGFIDPKAGWEVRVLDENCRVYYTGAAWSSYSADVLGFLNAADKSAARTVLGLGALATKSTVGYADLSASVGGRNLLPNSGFEQALTGWSAINVDSYAVSTERALVGVRSLKLVETTAGAETYVMMTISARANTSYVFSAWLYVESITAGAIANRSILAVDSGGVAANDLSLTSSHPTGVWTRKVLRITTGASATTLNVRLYCPQGTVYWDCVQVEEGDVPTAWRPNTNDTTMARLEAGLGAQAVMESPGYASGSGGTVTQATSQSTAVTLNKQCGTITLASAALAAGSAVTFTVTNSTVAATDLILAEHVAGGTLGAYKVTAHTPAAGSFALTVRNLTAGALTEAPQVRFAVIKTVNA